MSTTATTRAMKPADVAKRYGVSDDKVRAWIAAGELRAVDISTRRGGRPRWAITPEALAAFEAARSCTPPPKPSRRRRRGNENIIEFFR